jgi:type I restriction enzyme S subunit
MKRWPIKPLIEVCSPKQWPTVSTAELTKTGFPVYGANGQIGHYHSYNHEEPTILITCRGATCGTLNISPPRAYVTGNAMALDNPRLDIIDFRFFYYALLERGLGDTINGAAQPQITRASLSRVSVPVPPLIEQKRIVKLLDEADELRKLRAQADRRTAALIPAIFHEMFGDPNFPKVALRELATKERNSLTNGPFGSDLLSSELTDSGVPVIYIRDISSGSYERKSTVCVTPAKAIELEFCNAKPGDVLVAKVGTPPGIAAVYPAKEPHAIVTQDVIRIRPNLERALPVYIEGFINSSLGLGEVRNITIQATRQRFSLGQFKEIKVQVPPLSLQKEFAARVSEIRAVQTEQAVGRCRLDDLFQSLLHRAFQGEL